jgi:capsular polysaccharide biosynthesis protein
MNLQPLQHSFRKHLRDAWIVPVLAVLSTVAVVAGLAVLKTPEYSSEVKILVVQKYTLTDSYTASKSAEKISRNLAEVVTTSSFLDTVADTNAVNLDAILAMDEADKREEWKETLEAEVVSNTSMLKLTAYDEDPAQAEAIVQAVSNALVERGADYHGAPDTIALRVVDTALTSDHPTRPNLLANGAAAAVFGTMLGLMIVFLKPSFGFNVKKAKVGQTAANDPEYTKPSGGSPASIIDVSPEPTGPTSVANAAPALSYAVLDVTNYNDHLTAELPQLTGLADATPEVQTFQRW